jgi:hypothetical protein
MHRSVLSPVREDHQSSMRAARARKTGLHGTLPGPMYCLQIFVLRGLVFSFHFCKAFDPEGTVCRLREGGQLDPSL